MALEDATIAAGDACDTPFYAPTMLTGLTPENLSWKDEIFGPVALVMKFSTLEEAVALAGDNG